MAKYKCTICGYVYDEEKEGVKFESLPESWTCPRCGVPKSMFKKVEDDSSFSVLENKTHSSNESLESYLKEYQNTSEKAEWVKDIHTMAKTGGSIISPMATKKSLVSWDDILILGAQLNPMPLDEHDDVSLKTVIGKHAKKPMILDSPIYISHMSFGALSKEVKISLAKGSASVKTAICSGEGGILEDEIKNAYRYIFEYVPNLYSVTNENLKRVDAIEIKIGQGTKPGMGGHLPGSKVTEEIAKVRGKKVGEDIISPSKFDRIKTKDDLKNLVEELRDRSEGRPIGIKIAAGHIEEDLEWVSYAKPDFVTIDGRGGSTGASPKVVRDSTSIPTIYALSRARKYLDEHHLDIDLIITGGLHVSSDFAKALAMGASAVAIATSAMVAAACEQFLICETGMCPVGVATQNDELRSRIKIDSSAKRVENFLRVCNEELKTFARITSHCDIHELSLFDLATLSEDIANHTGISFI